MTICSKELLNELLLQLSDYAKSIFGEKFKSIILYGSYARGDFNEDSDIDVMIMADIDPHDVSLYRKPISDYCADINLDNGLLIVPIIQSVSQFEKWKDALPFYQNVLKEGVTI